VLAIRFTNSVEVPCYSRGMGHAKIIRSLVITCAVAALAAGGLLGQHYRDAALPIGRTSPQADTGSDRAEFYFARLVYTDPYAREELAERPWHIDSPAAERHFLQGVSRLSNIDARSDGHYLRPSDDDFFDYPWLYSVEPGWWDLTDEEVARIREYLLRGGFLVLDDFHGSQEWTSFQRGMRKIFPYRAVVDVNRGSEVFHTLFDVDPGEQIPGAQFLYSGRTYERDGVDPQWKGVYDDEGRLMVIINFNMDLGDAWEHADWPEYPERYTGMAYRMGINYVLYSMTH
jgi:hypothetical protein